MSLLKKLKAIISKAWQGYMWITLKYPITFSLVFIALFYTVYVHHKAEGNHILMGIDVAIIVMDVAFILVTLIQRLVEKRRNK